MSENTTLELIVGQVSNIKVDVDLEIFFKINESVYNLVGKEFIFSILSDIVIRYNIESDINPLIHVVVYSGVNVVDMPTEAVNEYMFDSNDLMFDLLDLIAELEHFLESLSNFK